MARMFLTAKTAAKMIFKEIQYNRSIAKSHTFTNSSDEYKRKQNKRDMSSFAYFLTVIATNLFDLCSIHMQKNNLFLLYRAKEGEENKHTYRITKIIMLFLWDQAAILRRSTSQVVHYCGRFYEYSIV